MIVWTWRRNAAFSTNFFEVYQSELTNATQRPGLVSNRKKDKGTGKKTPFGFPLGAILVLFSTVKRDVSSRPDIWVQSVSHGRWSKTVLTHFYDYSKLAFLYTIDVIRADSDGRRLELALEKVQPHQRQYEGCWNQVMATLTASTTLRKRVWSSWMFLWTCSGRSLLWDETTNDGGRAIIASMRCPHHGLLCSIFGHHSMLVQCKYKGLLVQHGHMLVTTTRWACWQILASKRSQTHA